MKRLVYIFFVLLTVMKNTNLIGEVKSSVTQKNIDLIIIDNSNLFTHILKQSGKEIAYRIVFIIRNFSYSILSERLLFYVFPRWNNARALMTTDALGHYDRSSHNLNLVLWFIIKRSLFMAMIYSPFSNSMRSSIIEVSWMLKDTFLIMIAKDLAVSPAPKFSVLPFALLFASQISNIWYIIVHGVTAKSK